MFARAGFLQFEVQYGKPAENLERVRALLDRMQPEADTLLVLPELWATGFDYDHAEELARQTPQLLEELTRLSGQYSVYLAGSLMEGLEQGRDGKNVFNTLFISGPGGVAGKYQKRHLFSYWQEDRFFLPGEVFPLVKTPWCLIGGLVCYDLRFPEVARQHTFWGARMLVVSAQWPTVRLDHWKTLLQARAIENQVFVTACNSCGKTGGHDLGGNSMVVAPDGIILLEGGRDEEGRAVALREGDVEQLRDRFCPAGERPRRVQDRKKYIDLETLFKQLAAVRNQGSKVAFTNGCFDILHSGHVSYLEKARETADCLVVGLNSDRSVRALKGEGRPVNNKNERARVLAALDCVDFVVLFSEETPAKLISEIMPDVLVKGADWPEDEIVGAREVRANGGDVVRVKFEHDLSTTSVISRIRGQNE